MSVTYLQADERHDEGALSSGSPAKHLYDLIFHRLVLGEFLPGEAIRQDTLAASLGVSKIPVREALGRLQRAGLVDYIANKGFVAREIQYSEFSEAERVRSIFEAEFILKKFAVMPPAEFETKRTFYIDRAEQCRGRDFRGVNTLVLSETVGEYPDSFVFRILQQAWSITDQFLASPSNADLRRNVGEASLRLMDAIF